MSVNNILLLLSKFAKYPVIALISIVVGIVYYDFTKDVVKATGFGLIFVGLPLLLMILIDIHMRGVYKYLVKRAIDSSAIAYLGVICIYMPNNLEALTILFFLIIVILWVMARKYVEYMFKEN